ncbi:MAG: cholesterol transport system auxiliary component [Campylobacterota bacterium]|nr:cholesterol transport system auxiliary component [Campylobacterota bacterium]
MRVVLLFLALLLSGCVTKKEPIAELGINIEKKHSVGSSQGCRDKSLKVSQAFGSMALGSVEMSYTDEEGRIFNYSQAKWQDTPSNIVTMEILKNARQSELFQSVLSSKSRSKSDFVLEVHIEDFMQYFQKERSFILFSYVLALVDTKTNAVMATKTFSTKIDAKTLDAKGGAEAYRFAFEELFAKNTIWLNEVCK